MYCYFSTTKKLEIYDLFSAYDLEGIKTNQLCRSEGIINYAVKADFPKKHFWTFSIWKDKVSVRRFTSQEPHATAIKKFETWAGEDSAFVEWTSKSNKIDWTEGLQKLQNPTFYYRQKG